MDPEDLEYFTGELETDGEIMEGILSYIDIKSGTNRKNMCKEGGSVLYGSSWQGFLSYDKVSGEKILRKRDPDRPSRFLTKLKVERPDLMDVFEEYRNLHFPQFQFNQVMINKSYPIGRHKDKKNCGVSYLVTFGEFQGGKTRVYGLHAGVDYSDLDSKNSPVSFDGSQLEHECLPFQGDRYALVFFWS